MSFRDEQVALLAASGWSRCDSVAAALADAGLPPVTAQYLGDMFSAEQWKTAEAVTAALREHFSDARFAEETTYGVLLVPDPAKLDTRRAMSPDVRHDQLGRLTPDVFDERLPPGTLGISPGQDWTLVATVTGPYGISLGSYENVSEGPAEAFTVEGHDTRALMIRQMWGARILQSGPNLDSLVGPVPSVGLWGMVWSRSQRWAAGMPQPGNWQVWSRVMTSPARCVGGR